MQRAFVLFYMAVIAVGVIDANAATFIDRVVASSTTSTACVGVHAKAEFPRSHRMGPLEDATRRQAGGITGDVVKVDGRTIRLRLEDSVYTLKFSARDVPAAVVYGGTEMATPPRVDVRGCI